MNTLKGRGGFGMAGNHARFAMVARGNVTAHYFRLPRLPVARPFGGMIGSSA